MARWIRFWPLIVIGIMAMFPLVRLLMGESLGPWDQISGMVRPGSKPPASAWDVLQADSILQFYVWRDLVFTSWSRGEIPYWNPYELCGTPLLANSQSGALYPMHILLGLLHFPTVAAMNLLAWFHLAVAGAGVAWLVVRLSPDTGRPAQIGGLIAGIGFSTCTFMTSWATLPSVISTVAWIPWLLACGVSTRPDQKPLAIGWPILFGGMMLLAGHLQFSFYGFLAYGLMVVSGALTQAGPMPAKVKSLGVLLLAGTLGAALLAGPQLLPVLDNGSQSHRKNSPTEEGFQANNSSSIAPFELAGLASPALLGDPKQGPDPGSSVSTATPANLQISTYWPQFIKRGANLAEGAVFLIPILIAGLVMLRRSDWRSWTPTLIVTITGLGLAFGTPLNRLFYFLIPGWSATGSPGRAIVLALIGLCVLGGIGLARFIQDEFKIETQAEKLRIGGFIAVPILVLAISLNIVQLAKSFTPIFPGVAPDWLVNQISATGGAGMISAAALAVLTSGGLFTAFRYPGFRPQILAGCAVVLVALSSFGATRTAPFEDLRLDAQMAEPGQRVAVINRNWGMFSTPTTILPPNLLALSRIPELSGYDSILNRGFVNRLTTANGQDPAPPENGNMMLTKPTFDSDALESLGVDSLISTTPIPRMNSVKHPTLPFFVTKVGGVGRVMVRQGSAKIEYDGFDRQVVSVSPGTRDVLIYDRYTENWQSITPGATLKTFDIWRFVELQPGVTRFELRYTTGLRGAFAFWIGLLTLFAAIGSIALPVLRSRNPLPQSAKSPDSTEGEDKAVESV